MFFKVKINFFLKKGISIEKQEEILTNSQRGYPNVQLIYAEVLNLINNQGDAN